MHSQSHGSGSDAGWGQRVREALFTQVDMASLAYFRIAFGLIMLWEVHRYFQYDWIRRYWIAPDFHFTYYGFGWVSPLPGDGMYWLFIGMGVLSVLIALGLWYRISMALFFLAFTYMFLLDQARYLNHFYLISLISFLMIFLPLNRAFSLDAKLWPETARTHAPAWALWLLRFQIGVPYFFGGVAKLNADWLRAEPMRTWLSHKTDFPVIGRWFTEEWMVYNMSYGGLFLDLFVVPALLWHRTRTFAFAFAVLFHCMNARMFGIGIFPWFMIAATLMFYAPDWPRRVFAVFAKTPAPEAPETTTPLRAQRVIVALLVAWTSFQCLFPMRHLLYPGNPSWTEEGHRFAWHMMLRRKTGSARFYVYDNQSDRRWIINPREWLPSTQDRKMVAHPDMILQFAHYLADVKRQQGYPDVSVYADSRISLNSRRHRPLIDSAVDLTQVKRSLLPAPWIRPLDEPLWPTEEDQATDDPDDKSGHEVETHEHDDYEDDDPEAEGHDAVIE